MTVPKLAYRIDEAVRATGLSRTTIWRLVKAGTLRPVRRGRRVLIPADQVEALVALDRAA